MYIKQRKNTSSNKRILPDPIYRIAGKWQLLEESLGFRAGVLREDANLAFHGSPPLELLFVALFNDKLVDIAGARGQIGVFFPSWALRYIQSMANKNTCAYLLYIIPNTEPHNQIASSGSLRSRGPASLPNQPCPHCPCSSPGRPLHSASFASATQPWRLQV